MSDLFPYGLMPSREVTSGHAVASWQKRWNNASVTKNAIKCRFHTFQTSTPIYFRRHSDKNTPPLRAECAKKVLYTNKHPSSPFTFTSTAISGKSTILVQAVVAMVPFAHQIDWKNRLIIALA